MTAIALTDFLTEVRCLSGRHQRGKGVTGLNALSENTSYTTEEMRPTTFNRLPFPQGGMNL